MRQTPNPTADTEDSGGVQSPEVPPEPKGLHTSQQQHLQRPPTLAGPMSQALFKLESTTKFPNYVEALCHYNEIGIVFFQIQ